MATPVQIAAGVIEPIPETKKKIVSALTFTSCPSQEEIHERAQVLARIALVERCNAAMIGGAGYLMGPLEDALRNAGIRPLHSFTKRVAVDEPQSDGSVKKTQTFIHEAFVGEK